MTNVSVLKTAKPSSLSQKKVRFQPMAKNKLPEPANTEMLLTNNGETGLVVACSLLRDARCTLHQKVSRKIQSATSRLQAAS